jgi:hypothetical protein
MSSKKTQTHHATFTHAANPMAFDGGFHVIQDDDAGLDIFFSWLDSLINST